MIRLKKLKNIKDLPKAIGNTVVDYSKSVLFMAFLVGLLRAGLCIEFSPKNLGVTGICKNSIKQINFSLLVGSHQLAVSCLRPHLEDARSFTTSVRRLWSHCMYISRGRWAGHCVMKASGFTSWR